MHPVVRLVLTVIAVSAGLAEARAEDAKTRYEVTAGLEHSRLIGVGDGEHLPDWDAHYFELTRTLPGRHGAGRSMCTFA